VSGLLRDAYDWNTAWLAFAVLAITAGAALVGARSVFRRASLARGAVQQ